MSKRFDNLPCNLIELSSTLGGVWSRSDTKIVYRKVGPIFIIGVVDILEPELGILDLMQVCDFI